MAKLSNECYPLMLSIVGTAPFASALTHPILVMLRFDSIDWRAITIFIVLWFGFSEICFLILQSSQGAAVHRLGTFSFQYEKSLTLLWAPSCIAQVGVLLTRNPWSSGDGPSHLQLLRALQSQGPYFLNPFQHLTELPGPPYPQSLHVLVLTISKLVGDSYLTDTTLMLLGLYGGFCLPFTLHLYGRMKLGQLVPDHTLLVISLMLAPLLTYKLSLGTFSALLAIPSSLFLATVIGEVKIEWAKIALINFGILLLLNIHPSGVVSLVFLIKWNQWKNNRSIRNLIGVLAFSLTIFVLLSRFTNLLHFGYLVSTWQVSQRNELFEVQSSEITSGVIRTLWKLLTLESPTPILSLFVAILGWYSLTGALLARNPDVTKTVFAVVMFGLSYLSGIPNSLGQLTGLSTLLYYSTPQRFVYIPIILMFVLTINQFSLHMQFERRSNFTSVYLIKKLGRSPFLSALFHVMWTVSVILVWLTLPPR